MDLSSYLVYVGISVIASISLGPSVVWAASNGVNFGRRKALFGVVGHVSAIFILAILSVSGITTLLVTNDVVFTVVKILGCFYLAYIGLLMWKSKGNWSLQQSEVSSCTHQQLYRKGLVLGLSNPKALVFFTALFPQFLNVDNPLLPQFVLLISTSLVNAFIFTSIYVIVGHKLKSKLLPIINSGQLGRITGATFFGFAAMLAAGS